VCQIAQFESDRWMSISLQNVHGILLTAVHDGGTGEDLRIVLSRSITFIAYQIQQLRDLEELNSSGTLATTGPAMIIRSVIRLDTKLQRQLRESFHWSSYYLHCTTDKYIYV